MTAAAVQLARRRKQTAAEIVKPLTAVIAGTSYACAGTILSVQPEQRSDGTGTVMAQRAIAIIRKTLLTTAPARETVVRLNSTDFTLDSIGGQNSFDVAWKLNLVRIP